MNSAAITLLAAMSQAGLVRQILQVAAACRPGLTFKLQFGEKSCGSRLAAAPERRKSPNVLHLSREVTSRRWRRQSFAVFAIKGDRFFDHLTKFAEDGLFVIAMTAT
jgi:hypothetical protein